MKISKLIRFFCAAVLAIASFQVDALEREYEIKVPSSRFPVIKVKEANGEKTWQVYRSDGADFVALFFLRLSEAKELLVIADKALAAYDEIVAAGRCPVGIVRSGRLGEINRRSRMAFEVVCERNNVQVEIKMYDEYVVNFLTTRVEASQLKDVARRLVSELER